MAAEIFAKFPKDIKGETAQAGHVDEVPISSIQWGLARNISLVSGSRQTSVPSFSDVVMTKQIDSASSDLAKACSFATPLDEIVITFRKDAGEESLGYLTYTLTDCLISSYTVSASLGAPTEAFSISYVKIASTYKKQASNHSSASDHEFEFDLRARV